MGDGQRVAEILIDGNSSDLTFSYAVPDDWDLSPGTKVVVPLRGRNAIGTVVSVELEGPGVERKYQLKPISKKVGEKAFLTPSLLKLADWIMGYYGCSRESVFRAMLPKNARGSEQKAKYEKHVFLSKRGKQDGADGEISRSAKKQIEAFDAFLEDPEKVWVLARFLEEKEIGRASVMGLEAKGLVVIEDRVVSRDPTANETFVESKALTLNKEQAVVLEEVKKACLDEKRKPLLLFGVTGSGKTEVYLQAIQHVLDQGKGAIVLVPEISLTPQTAGRFKQRFAKIQDQVAILHSNLSEGERHDELKKVLDRKAKIVIGARSAIFSPVDNLGLIVVDEEHENSYKQDTTPRYQARDVAVVRGHLEGCPVLLGSATPSLESWNNATVGKYQLVTMLQRIDDRKLPLVRVLDMKLETQKQGGGLAILSSKLREEVEVRLAEGEQVILFLNRRGFARSILCPDCGYVANCPNCSTTLTLHQKEDKLLCHICGFGQLPPRRCPECSSKAIANSGFGTEKVEQVLKAVFPHARTARIDTDSMRRKNALRDTLDKFKAKKIDIIIGTQMIAKGLHFPNVTLVGLLNADVGLHIPDIRASERTFQLITQVAGRAGRGELEGEVIVQTFTPHHPAIQFGRHHDFEGFADQELAMRKQFNHPPFVHLCVITVRSAHLERAKVSLETFHLRLKRKVPEGIAMTDPLPSPLEKSHGKYRFQIMLKAVNPRRIARHLRDTMQGLTFPDDVIVTIDIDPYNLS